jgi:hypothetical protein
MKRRAALDFPAGMCGGCRCHFSPASAEHPDDAERRGFAVFCRFTPFFLGIEIHAEPRTCVMAVEKFLKSGYPQRRPLFVNRNVVTGVSNGAICKDTSP